MAKATKKKRKFSSFKREEAFARLNIEDILTWHIDFQPLPQSDYFKERMRRLEGFAIDHAESGKELLIDAICEEIVNRYPNLRIWKTKSLESEELTGFADYLVARKMGYVSHPLLCVVEAKTDDFTQGMAQCLVEMEACRENNVQSGFSPKVLGIVSNGEGWKFYRLDETGKVWESLLYTIAQIEILLGAVDSVFNECDELLNLSTQK